MSDRGMLFLFFEEIVCVWGIWSFEFGGLRWRRDFFASTPRNGESTGGNLYEPATANIFEFACGQAILSGANPHNHMCMP